MRPSVHKLYLVCTITLHRFGLESTNDDQCHFGHFDSECLDILLFSRLVLKMTVIELYLQGNLGAFGSELKETWRVHMITSQITKFMGQHGAHLGPVGPMNLAMRVVMNLSQKHLICNRYESRDSPDWYWKWGGFDLDLEVHFAISTQNSMERIPCWACVLCLFGQGVLHVSMTSYCSMASHAVLLTVRQIVVNDWRHVITYINYLEPFIIYVHHLVIQN